MNRDLMRRLFAMATAAGMDMGDWDADAPADDGNPVGTLQEEIQLEVDVSAYLDRKRAALQAHSSQTTDVGMMLSMPPEAFDLMFGTEHYLEPDRQPTPVGMRSGWILDS